MADISSIQLPSGSTYDIKDAEARNSINSKATMSTVSVTINAADWSSNTCTKTVSGVTASNTVIVSSDVSSIDNYCEAGVKATVQAVDSLTFTCETTPSVALSVNVVILE